MSGEKYYDDLYHPNAIYPRNDGTKTYLKTIRITKEEEANWNSKEVHEFLQENTQSNDSIKNNKLTVDLHILKKMIPAFVEFGIKIILEENEIDRIKQLWSEINHE